MTDTAPSLTTRTLLDLIKQQRYGVEYQPLLEINSLDIFAYESLSRFYTASGQAIAPDLVFSALHHNPLCLFQVEFAQKDLQLSNSPKHQLFVNLDQDSYFASGERGLENPFLTLFSQSPNELVVELIENSGINDANMSLAMIDILSTSNINTAIDDVCNPSSMISTSVLQKVDYIKFDRNVTLNRDQHEFMILVRSLIDYAKQAGKKTVLEGIETQEDLAFAKALSIDLVQGFLFKPLFINK